MNTDITAAEKRNAPSAESIMPAGDDKRNKYFCIMAEKPSPSKPCTLNGTVVEALKPISSTQYPGLEYAADESVMGFSLLEENEFSGEGKRIDIIVINPSIDFIKEVKSNHEKYVKIEKENRTKKEEFRESLPCVKIDVGRDQYTAKQYKRVESAKYRDKTTTVKDIDSIFEESLVQHGLIHELWIGDQKQKQGNYVGTINQVSSCKDLGFGGLFEISFDMEDLKKEKTHSLVMKTSSENYRKLIKENQEVTVRVRNGHCTVEEGFRTPTPPSFSR